MERFVTQELLASKTQSLSIARDGNEVNINMPKAPDGRPVDEENHLSPCRITFKFPNEAVKYVHFCFDDKPWNTNET